LNFKGRTVLFLIGLSIVVSSLITTLVVGNGLNGDLSFTQPSEKNSETKSTESSKDIEKGFKKIEEAYDVIRQNYVLDLDEKRLLEGAIEGMLNTLEDPYSVYMDPETAEQFRSSLQSSFEGIGAEVMIQNGRVTIVAPIRGAPAEKAGLRPNDQIISVNGESIEGLDLYEAVIKIRGPKDSKAILKIARPGIKEPIEIKVVRDEIPLETIYSDTIKAGGKTFGKIQITSFAEETANDFGEALQNFEQKGIDGLVIDVRGNPGGYLDAVRDIGSMLVPDEGVITKIETRDGKKAVYRSTLKKSKPYPITILVDKGSASASEILAGTLKEAGKYNVVGTTTFGKGTVQSTLQLGDTSEIKLTIAKWLTPNENWIHGKGIEPTIAVEQPVYFSAAPIQLEPALERNANNENVQNLQVILKGLGYDAGKEDGFYSIETEMAVKSFQAKNNLKATGKVDEKTASLLQERLIEVIKDPKNDLQLQKAVKTLLGEIKK
jgi:carboxyl-terminal processing protease